MFIFVLSLEISTLIHLDICRATRLSLSIEFNTFVYFFFKQT